MMMVGGRSTRRRKAAAASLPVSSCRLAPLSLVGLPDGCESADTNRTEAAVIRRPNIFFAACVTFSTSAVAEEGGSLRDVRQGARESRDRRRQQEPSEAEVRDVELTGLTGQTPSAGCLLLAPAVAISTEERWFCRNPLCAHSLCLLHAFWSGCAGLLRVLCLFSLMDIFFVSLRASEARGLEQRLKESRDAISESCLFSGIPITLRRCENVLLCTSFPSSKLYC